MAVLHTSPTCSSCSTCTISIWIEDHAEFKELGASRELTQLKDIARIWPDLRDIIAEDVTKLYAQAIDDAKQREVEQNELEDTFGELLREEEVECI